MSNFAREADKVLKINEEDVISEGGNPYAYSAESGAARLVRTAAKALLNMVATNQELEQIGKHTWMK